PPIHTYCQRLSFVFFHAPPPTQIYTLSLHDALPISPTLTVAGHTTIASGGVSGCSNCHETAPYLGMMASSNTAAGDSRPNTTLDSKHPTTGDCGNCHVTSPTFAANLLPTAGKPTNHVPT